MLFQKTIFFFCVCYLDQKNQLFVYYKSNILSEYMRLKTLHAMFLTSYILIKYWIYNKQIIDFFDPNNKHKKKILFFGIASALALTVHSIFLGIKFDNDIYKLFRRVVMLAFIIFEIVAQAYLVKTLYSFKNKLNKYINILFLKLKLLLVGTLIIVAIISIPLISLPVNLLKV